MAWLSSSPKTPFYIETFPIPMFLFLSIGVTYLNFDTSFSKHFVNGLFETYWSSNLTDGGSSSF